MRPARIVVSLCITVAAAGLCACGDKAGPGDLGPAVGTPAAGAPAAKDSAASAHFGAGCGAVPSGGPGSFEGMAADPVATAASHNPVLSMFSDAVKKANLFDSLNGAQSITVFAPANAAFQKLPTDTLNGILADNARLSELLNYHVVSRRIAPAELEAGNFTSLAGATLSTSGSGQDFRINGVPITCGNVQTANATVYIIDSLLMPPGH